MLEDPVMLYAQPYSLNHPVVVVRTVQSPCMGKEAKLLLAIFWKMSWRLGPCRIELHYGTVWGKEFRPSFLRNLVTANKRGDDVSKTVP